MEAYKFGFHPDTPPAFKFDPTDADIVAHYLLPRALGLPNPYGHAIIDYDPGSAPPSELLRRYGNGQIVDHAFFFGHTTDGGRKSRTVKGGGVWKGQNATEGTVTLIGSGGAEVDITYRRYDLSFCLSKRGRSTGYVMHEYEITKPVLPGKVLTRVKIAENAKKKKAPVAGADHDQQVVLPNADQPGTSYDHEATATASNGDGLSDAQAGDLYYGGDMADAGDYYKPLNYVLPLDECDGYCLPVSDQPAASHSQGNTGVQADAFYDGGMVETNGACYDPSQFVPVASAEYNNYYGQYQEPRPYQVGQSHGHNQYHAGEDVVMCSDNEQFSAEQQAGALCGCENAVMCSDNGQQAGALGGYAGDAAVMCFDNERFSGEQQAGAICGYADDAAVMCSGGEGLSGKQQAGALIGDAGDAAVMCSGGEGLGDEQQAGAL